jgi:RNA polymerase sigma-70 factor (ECF subfamily)
MVDDTERLWAEFAGRLRAFIARRVGDAADADDILQEVFLRLHQHRGAVGEGDRLVAWLFRVARNAIADHHRAPARRRELAGPVAPRLADRPAEGADPALALALDRTAAQARREVATCLAPLVERLPRAYGEAVRLVELDGLTQPAAAARVNLSVSGMKSRVQRGRRALKDLLQGCCRVQVDRAGRVTDYEPGAAGCCQCACGGARG